MNVTIATHNGSKVAREHNIREAEIEKETERLMKQLNIGQEHSHSRSWGIDR